MKDGRHAAPIATTGPTETQREAWDEKTHMDIMIEHMFQITS